jgi:4-deoxy-L-threo-5-hexosulose-uronate ketol-isomerase
MNILHSVHPNDFRNYSTALIRERFLLGDLKQDGQANFVYTHYDRMVAGLVKPDAKTIKLGLMRISNPNIFREEEMGIINVGGGKGFCRWQEFLIKEIGLSLPGQRNQGR